jgi:hypothetical protein
MGAARVHGIKFDGHRVQARIVGRGVVLRIRKGLDWTQSLPEIAAACEGLPEVIIDGEFAALDANGAPDFTGDAPGGPSRRSTDRSAEGQKLRTELVVEVTHDRVTDCRFPHSRCCAAGAPTNW